MRCSWIIALLLAMGSPWCSAQSTRPATRPASVQRQIDSLLEQFAGGDWLAGQKAQIELVKLGDLVVSDLQQFRRRTEDEDLRASIDAMLAQIEDARPVLTCITLHLKDADLREVLAQMSAQAGLTVALDAKTQAQPIPRLSIDVDVEPFWLVIRQIAQKTGIGPASPPLVAAHDNSRNRITLSGGSDFATLPGQMSRNFYVTAACSVQRVPQSQILLSIYADPKLSLVPERRQKIGEIQDATGKSLRRFFSSDKSGSDGSDRFRLLRLGLRDAPNPGAKIAGLQGSVWVQAAIKRDVWEISDVLHAHNASHRMPYGTWAMPQLERVSDDVYHVNFTLEYERGQAQPPGLSGDYDNFLEGMRLLDANGRSWRAADSNYASGLIGGQAPPRRIFRCTFRRDRAADPRLGEPAKLVWELPLDTQEIEVPVDLKDLPILAPPAPGAGQQ